MGKTRIAIMIPTISSGGAEKVAADMSIYFQQRGFEVFIFVEYMQKLKDYAHGGKLICVERKLSIKSGYSSRKMLFGLIQQANIYRGLKRKYKIDITISFLQLSNLLNIISRDRDKVVVTLHSVMSYRTDQYRLLGYGKKNIYIFVNYFMKSEKIITSQLSKFIIDRQDEALKNNIIEICNEFEREVNKYNEQKNNIKKDN